MTPREAAKLAHQSRERLEAEINAYAEQYRPKIERIYYENGIKITRYETGHADGCGCHQYIKPTGRSGEYEM